MPSGVQGGVGGGNFLILCTTGEVARAAALAAIDAMRQAAQHRHAVPRRRGALGLQGGLALQGADRLDQRRLLPDHPRPGGADARCRTRSGAVLEIVIDGLSEADVATATAVGVRAACSLGRGGGVVAISAGNYGGQLGPYHFHLRKVLQ